MLARPPARVQRGNFDTGNGEIRNGSYASIENACFEEAEDAIEAVCSSSNDDVMQINLFMGVDLLVHYEASFSVDDLPKPANLP